MNVNSPIPAAWNEYVTMKADSLEIIPSVLYSTKMYDSGVTTILSFFDEVNGARPDLSNMTQQNMLPNPESFLIQNIRIFTWHQPQSNNSGAGANTDLTAQFSDVVALTRRGILTLKISNKIYGPWPLWTLPAHNFVKGAFASGSDVLADYGQVDGMLYELRPYLMIAPVQQFTVTLTWPGQAGDAIPGGAVTLAAGDVPIQILFDGQRGRSVN